MAGKVINKALVEKVTLKGFKAPTELPLSPHEVETISENQFTSIQPLTGVNPQETLEHLQLQARNRRDLVWDRNSRDSDRISTDIQPTSPSSLDFLEWLPQIDQRDRRNAQTIVKRPRLLWWIAYTDIILIGLYTTAGFYLVSLLTVSSNGGMVITFVNCGVGILFQLLMGLCLVTGLQSVIDIKLESDDLFLRYCRVWTYFQLPRFFVSPLEVVSCVILYAMHPLNEMQNHWFILAIIVIFIYRIVSLIVVSLFIGKLKRAG